jgi:acylphosphatase
MGHMKWLTGRTTDGPAAANDSPAPDAVRMTAWVHGFVQGVGFRWWTNLADGRVEVVVEGTREACEALLTQLRGVKTPGGVDKVVAQFGDARGGLRGFTER